MKRALFLIVVLGAVLLSPLPAGATAGPAPSSNQAFAQIAGCISGADNLLVSVVVDESLSLRQTDPRALRVQGITSAIDSLEQLAQVTPTVNVEVSLSTFARGFDGLLDWRQLDARTAEQLRSTAASELPKRDAGNATDYRRALLGAKQELETRARQLHDDAACKVLLWFTDGALDVDASTSQAATQICQRGGIADSVRHAGINVVALALFTPGAGVTASQRAQLQAVAEGQGPGQTCGTVPLASDDAQGVYLPANDPAALQLLFAGAGALVAGGTSVDSVSCPGVGCTNGRYLLKIDPGISGARVIVQGAGAVQLQSPGGAQVRLKDGLSRNLGDAAVDVLQRDSLTTINLSFSDLDRRPQTWVVTPAGRSLIDTYWFWGARLDASTSSVTAGQDNVIEFQLEDSAGSAIPAELYAGLTADVRANGEHLRASVSDKGVIRARYPLGTDSVPSAVSVAVEVSAHSRPSHVALGPIRHVSRLDVALPPAYPTITPKSLDFGTLQGVGSRKATLRVTGSQLGETKVCIAGSSFTVPGVDQTLSVASQSRCQTIPQGGTRNLGLTLSPDISADGVAQGVVDLDVTSSDGDHVHVKVPGSLDMARKVDQGKRWELIFALILMALLIPLVLLIGCNILLLGKFTISSGSRVANVPIRIRSDGVTRLDGSALVEPDDLRNVPVSGTKRSSRIALPHAPIALRATRLFSLKSPRGIATAAGARRLVSGFGAKQSRAPQEAPVGLGNVDAAFVVVENQISDEEATGRLIVAIPAGVDAAGAIERARVPIRDTDWRQLLAGLSNHEPSAATASATGAQTGSSPAPSSGGEALPNVPSWLGGDAANGTPQPAEPRAKSRRTPRSTEPPPPPPASSGHGLPPLPDFLRDKD